MLTCRGANDGPGKTQEQQWCNPAGVKLPTLVTTLLAVLVIPARAVRKGIACHGGGKQCNGQRFGNFFHRRSDLGHACLTPKLAER